jgi:hypothetical protein
MLYVNDCSRASVGCGLRAESGCIKNAIGHLAHLAEEAARLGTATSLFGEIDRELAQVEPSVASGWRRVGRGAQG